jgi:hypothetical protein
MNGKIIKRLEENVGEEFVSTRVEVLWSWGWSTFLRPRPVKEDSC